MVKARIIMAIQADTTSSGAEADNALAGRYELIRRLTSHNTCQVYEAFDRVLARTVAVKVLTDAKIADDDLKRFHRGARAASAIVHSNVAQVLDFGTAPDGRPYTVMEFVKGETLRRKVEQDGPLPSDIVIRLAIEICKGLTATHEQGIVHRDLKTANIIVNGLDELNVTGSEPGELPKSYTEHMKKKGKSKLNLQVKIVDFGIAKASEDQAPITKTGQIVGSPVYMSPEQVRGNALDARSDIYSVGCILFEVLTGEPLFLGRTSLETMGMHVFQTAPTLAKAAPDLLFPAALEELIARAVAKEPDDRFQTAEEMLEALEALALKMTMEETDVMLAEPEVATKPATPTWMLASLLLVSIALVIIGVALMFIAMKGH